MSLKTRIDGRSKDNKEFTILSKEGNVVATIALQEEQGVTLTVTTEDGAYLSKPNGWNSQRK